METKMFRRPKAATGADVTLTSETMLGLPMRVHDRALFGTWRTQYDAENPTPKAVKAEAAKVRRVTKKFKMPDVSHKLMWRFMRLFRDICHLSDNEDGYCFAHNKYFVDKYNRGHVDGRTKDGTFAPASEPTIRRWISELVEHGWIGSEISGPNRKLWPLVHPSFLLTFDCLKQYGREFFERHFKRLLTATLSGLATILPIVKPYKGVTKNNGKAQTNTQEKKPLEPALTDAQAEIIAAVNTEFGVDSDWATVFVTKSDKAVLANTLYSPVKALWDAFDATRLAIRNGKLKFNAGGYLRNWAEGLLAGKRTLPETVIKMREKELVQRQKAAMDEETRLRVEAETVQRDADKAADKARRTEAKRAAEEAQEREREASIPEPLCAPWKAVQAALNPDVSAGSPLNKPSWETHIKNLLPVRREGDKIVMGAPSPFNRDWVEKRLLAPLREEWARALGLERLTVEVVLLSRAGTAVSAHA